MDASTGLTTGQRTSDRLKSPHLNLAKNYWRSHLSPDNFVIDMTCGNGHDTRFLASLLPEGTVFSLDIQEIALKKAKILLEDSPRVHFLHQSHSQEILIPFPAPPRLIIYNLGYLPGGDKSITTQCETTIASLYMAIQILSSKGAICITCYPGHAEGLEEEKEIIAWAEKLEPSKWQVCMHRWLNRKLSPSLIWVTKNY